MGEEPSSLNPQPLKPLGKEQRGEVPGFEPWIPCWWVADGFDVCCLVKRQLSQLANTNLATAHTHTQIYIHTNMQTCLRQVMITAAAAAGAIVLHTH